MTNDKPTGRDEPPPQCTVWQAGDGSWRTRVHGFLLGVQSLTREDAVLCAWMCATDFDRLSEHGHAPAPARPPRDESVPAPGWVREERDGAVFFRPAYCEVFDTQGTWAVHDSYREHAHAPAAPGDIRAEIAAAMLAWELPRETRHDYGLGVVDTLTMWADRIASWPAASPVPGSYDDFCRDFGITHERDALQGFSEGLERQRVAALQLLRAAGRDAGGLDDICDAHDMLAKSVRLAVDVLETGDEQRDASPVPEPGPLTPAKLAMNSLRGHASALGLTWMDQALDAIEAVPEPGPRKDGER